MPQWSFLRRGRRWLCRVGLLNLWVCSALLLAGCSKPQNGVSPRAEEEVVQVGFETPISNETQATPVCWGFSQDTRLVSLPSVDDESIESPEAPTTGTETADFATVPGRLLPPQVSPGETLVADAPELLLFPPVGVEEELHEAAKVEATPVEEKPVNAVNAVVEAAPEEVPMQAPVEAELTEEAAVKETPVSPVNSGINVPALSELSIEESRLLRVIEQDQLAVATGAPTDSRLDQQCREKIGVAFVLSQRGAVYAARQELIEVLRLVSQSKDNREGTRQRSESLAAGLRALEEAEDFTPRGTELEAEMSLEVICASHRTPIAREVDLATLLPSQLVERYNRYAQLKLALAVAGEPAGSMALYALGKLSSQLAGGEPDQGRAMSRDAVAYQQAALLAHNQNYLAAHELGVLLAETGHLAEARNLFEQVAQREPDAVVYRNLARVNDELGVPVTASMCRAKAEQLAQQGRGPATNIAWVSPQEFAQQGAVPAQPYVANNMPGVITR